ncbi:MAG: hypothetical protein ACR2NP_23220 [Pirellulaceae bacterium]
MPSKSDILKAAEPVPCPECAEMFLLPEGMDASTSLACPHCDEEITGKQIMENLLPTAAIVKNSVTTESAESDTLSESAPQIDQTTTTGSSKISHPFDEQSYTIPKPLKTAQRRTSSRYPQRKKKSRKKKKDEKPSGFGELWRIGLGFLLALPIAQLVLWWVFTVDPIGIAPQVHKYAPFFLKEVVPKSVYRPEPTAREEVPANKDMPATQKMRDDNIPFSIK